MGFTPHFTIEPLKEPRGFIKCLQIFFAIIAFSIVVNYDGSFSIKASCKDGGGPTEVNFPLHYPFQFDHLSFAAKCRNTYLDAHMSGNFASDAKFFVFTGVLSMLLAAGVLVAYLLFDHVYQENRKLVIADFVLAVILAAFWLAGSSAWANGLSGISSVADPTEYIGTRNGNEFCSTAVVESCTPGKEASFSSLTVSVLIGFINFILWSGNLWFLYKETPWFKPVADPKGPPSQQDQIS
ncbi:unnamed protein product [Cyprideis torosa]|uniref:Uncharacterized protein n=1 Tax=Cyprideis torosa TaxID=163714 RepID=A0A7R8WLZ1_9CRUS|nr:unnamed protein product [Cyprideis torosa]CAG0904844.1 unnamed protein product [Cyprideis torosa]